MAWSLQCFPGMANSTTKSDRARAFLRLRLAFRRLDTIQAEANRVQTAASYLAVQEALAVVRREKAAYVAAR